MTEEERGGPGYLYLRRLLRWSLPDRGRGLVYDQCSGATSDQRRLEGGDGGEQGEMNMLGGEEEGVFV